MAERVDESRSEFTGDGGLQRADTMNFNVGVGPGKSGGRDEIKGGNMNGGSLYEILNKHRKPMTDRGD